jgi:hypothetical protein
MARWTSKINGGGEVMHEQDQEGGEDIGKSRDGAALGDE